MKKNEGRIAVLERIEATKVAAVEPPIEEVVRRYVRGESPQVLAKECGVSDKTIMNRMKAWTLTGEADETWGDLVTKALAARIVDADEKLEGASDPVAVTKYAHIARFARTDYERRRPGIYGAKPIQVNVAAVSADAALVGTMGELLKTVVSAHAPATLEHEGAANTVTVK